MKIETSNQEFATKLQEAMFDNRVIDFAGYSFACVETEYSREPKFTYKAELREVSSQQPKPWSGPEDGLPPIGMKFAFKGLKSSKQDCLYAMNDWCAGDIVCVAAHVMLQGSLSALYWNEGKMSSSTVRPDLLELIRTPEEIAVDTRETAIRELMDIAQVDCRVTAARLVDAGFARKIIRSEENRSSAIESMKKVFDSVSDDLMPTSNKYLETLFGALCDAGFKLPSKSESRDNAVDAMELIVPHIGSVAAGKLYDAWFKREVV